ncbi:MAG TPA: NOL1/NOP2/sun family putative RNA methylase [candidate division WOR-3 bacterium]|uniref:NOL1/NOP2/sun family putative RNA methylase n=1 Tax=candidate division WOR-3 bacterium TaxID=2052148 RepID=A0A9C9K065_UNCW3|nr:NOL1/NOP2/sun family putative RNA methylase [candidate division WOR-3 bacterium]
MTIEKLFSRYRSIISDFNDFIEAVKKPTVQSFRINTLKAKREEILLFLKDLQIKELPFYTDGFLSKSRIRIGNHLTHGLGLIYVQEVASMIPVLVLEPKPDEFILDMCAAPGSKTTQIAQLMGNTGLLVANEMNRKRVHGLIYNIKRCGLLNDAVTCLRGQKLDKFLPNYFDRVLIDAPCSAEGTIRKSKAVLYHWGLKNIQKMARVQKGLLTAGFRVLRPGGTLVYSTCTIAPEENEAVVSYLLEKFPEAEVLPITIPHFKIRSGIKKWQNEIFDRRVEQCARILPQDNDTAPFFIAKLTKRGVYQRRVGYMGRIEFQGSAVELFTRRFGISKKEFDGYSVFQNRTGSYIATPQVYSFWEIKTMRKGLEMARIYDNDIKPDNDFVQLFGRTVKKNYFEAKEWQLKKFLKGESIRVDSSSLMEPGFVIMTYKKLPVALGKYNGKEIKSAVKRDRRTPL